MQQFSQPASASRWRPQWAFASAVIGLVMGALSLGAGLYLVVIDVMDGPEEWFNWLKAWSGAYIGIPGLLTTLAFVVFLARRGGKMPFFLGAGAGIIMLGIRSYFFIGMLSTL